MKTCFIIVFEKHKESFLSKWYTLCNVRIKRTVFYAFVQSCNITIDNFALEWYTNIRKLKQRTLQLYKTPKSCYNQEVLIMKIAVVCANGKAGQLIVKEAVDRGLDVTAVVRNENKTSAQNVIVKDLFDLTAAELADFDAVVDAFGAWTPETLPQHSTSLAHLCDILSGTDTRLLVVGGAGSLYVNAEHTACVSDGADFPEVFKPLASAMAKALGELRQRNDVKWTYISPAGDFQADGERSGKYILAGEELTLNSKGESIISYADYAIAMVDEIEKGTHIRQRISVVRE